jgi:ZIP family zinc transporter/zinc and cadmium transporter
MPIFLNITIYSFIAGLSTLLGVYLVKHFENWTKRNAIFLISFAVGVLLSAAFLELLPESVEASGNWMYWILGTIIIFYLMEHLMVIHSCREGECEVHNMGVMSVLGIGFHSLIDGITIAIAFQVGSAIGIMASFAVIFHETAEGIFTYGLLIHDNIPRSKALFYSWLVALATPAGAIATYFATKNISASALGILLSIAAGSFIYIGASDLVPATHKKQAFLNAILVLSGVGFVVLISYLAPGV